MQPNEFQKHLKDVLFGERGYGLSVFCCVKNNGVIQLKRFNVQDNFRGEINDLIIDALSSRYLDEDAVFDIADNIADNSNAFYLVEANENYNPYRFLSTSNSIEDAFSESDRSDLLGFAFCFSIDTKIVWAYQHVYPASKSKKSKGLLALISGENVFEKLSNNKLFCIEGRVDVVIIENTICPSKISFLENYFGFEVYIRNEAQNVVATIRETELINDAAKFNDFISKEKTTNAKKLLKIKNSPVLSMPKEVVIQRLPTIPRYSNIKIEDGQIIVTSQKDVSIILKMLNDDFLNSALSEKEYDSPAKKNIARCLINPVSVENQLSKPLAYPRCGAVAHPMVTILCRAY